MSGRKVFVSYKFFEDYLWTYGLWWYPFLLIAPAFSLLFAKCLDMLNRYTGPLIRFLSVFGKSSLEILLISDYCFANIDKKNIVIFSKGITPIIVVLISLIMGIIFHYCVEFLTNKTIKLSKSKANQETG